MADICQKFISKTSTEKNCIYFSYNGKAGKEFNEDLTFEQMASSIDNEKNEMAVLVFDINEIKQNNIENISIIKSKYIICPECGENVKMKVNHYKISLYGCKNKYKKNNILIDKFEETQKIDLSKIICDKCKENNMGKTFNKKFFKCISCNMKLCPICSLNHEENHNIIKYDQINFICKKHNEIFTKYCKECKVNICIQCEEEHLNHESIYFGNIMPNKKELDIKLIEFKKSLDRFNENINEIIMKLNKVKDNLNIYYNIKKDLINNYDNKNRNYEIMHNLKEINNDNIFDEINKINNENIINNKLRDIINIYNEMTMKNNEIKIKLEIQKNDIGKDIYFLNDSHFLNELNESNTELFINDVKHKYQKFFRPEKEGTYSIILKLKDGIKDCGFMFCDCDNIVSIDLSSFNSENIIKMNSMFSRCGNLKNINFSSFDTGRVTDMSCMFFGSKNLEDIDLSSFDTRNVINIENMFASCDNLKNIDLSSFDTRNVINMLGVFMNCENLLHINLSSLDTKKVTDMSHMFHNCYKLKNINLSSFDGKNLKNIEYICSDCKSLSSIDLSFIKDANNLHMAGFISDCSNLKTLKINKNIYEIFKKDGDKEIENPNKFFLGELGIKLIVI